MDSRGEGGAVSGALITDSASVDGVLVGVASSEVGAGRAALLLQAPSTRASITCPAMCILNVIAILLWLVPASGITSMNGLGRGLTGC